MEHDHELSQPEITPYARTDWSVEPGGGLEHRIHYGRSAEGYHYATEVSVNGGDMSDGVLAWSAPHASQADVKQAAHEAIAELVPRDLEHGNGFSL